MQTFNRGDSVYTENGQMCEYVAKVGGKHVVIPIYEYPDGGEHTGEPFSVSAVFTTDEGARSKLSKELDALDAKIRAKREEIAALESKATQLQRDQKATLFNLARHSALKNIEDFLAGKITHFLFTSPRGAEVQTLENVLQYKESTYDRSYQLRLLSLYGQTNGDITWEVNSYRDGSGHNKVVTPFCSEEEALSARDSFLRTELAKRLTAKGPLDDYAKVEVLCLVQAMKKCGLKDIPAMAQTLFDANNADRKAKRLAEVTAKLNAAQAELKALQESTE